MSTITQATVTSVSDGIVAVTLLGNTRPGIVGGIHNDLTVGDTIDIEIVDNDPYLVRIFYIDDDPRLKTMFNPPMLKKMS